MRLGDLVYYITKYTGIRYIWKKIYPDFVGVMNVERSGTI